MGKVLVNCKECNEPAVYKRTDGIYVCGACGHMFEGKPKAVHPVAKGNWKPEKPIKRKGK